MALETLLSTEIPSESFKDRWNYVLNGTFPNIFYSVIFFRYTFAKEEIVFTLI